MRGAPATRANGDKLLPVIAKFCVRACDSEALSNVSVTAYVRDTACEVRVSLCQCVLYATIFIAIVSFPTDSDETLA